MIGQRGVTHTLRNAIAANRIAQSFVFAGPRGVGKTTTARILARGLSCAKGPTADPCGACDACVEIAEGRDIDVLEIDAATHTGVDKVRDIIITGLGIAPVRNRFKIFVIDEVHRLSGSAFDALLKSIEEPPPHVVFMMATTEIEKVPPTIQSRSQVFELKPIAVKQIADQLRTIAGAEQIQIDDAALMLIARAGDGSMRDAQSAFDQVIGFAGNTITPDDVSTVLGLVRRDVLLDLADAVAAEDGAAAFALAGSAVETGYDLRTVIRELARLTRDLMVVKIDPSRLNDPEIAAEAERDRLKATAAKFSTEDLMRAFDVLTKAEVDIRGAASPRFHLEMALLRWIHLRKLVPLTDLIQGLEKGSRPAIAATPTAQRVPASAPRTADSGPRTADSGPRRAATTTGADPLPDVQPVAGDNFKEAFLNEIRKAKKFFHGSVVSMAQRIDVDKDRVVFTFAPIHRVLKGQLEQQKAWLETLATQLAGRKMTVLSAEGSLAPAAGSPDSARRAADSGPERQAELKQKAMENTEVQTMLDVFGAEIKEVEEM